MKKNLPYIGLFLLGLAVGFVVAWAVGAGASVGLFLGIVLVIAGAVVGFLAEWFIDEAHRRNRDEIKINVQANIPESIPQSEATVLAGFLTQRENEAQDLRQKLSVAEKELIACQMKQEAQARDLADLPQLKQRLTTTEEDLANWKLKPNELQTKLTSAEAVLADYRQKEAAYLEELEHLRTFKIKIETQPDDLTVIKGIGKVYQQKLRDIGVVTLKQLAEADPERIHRMLDIKKWQAADVAYWIVQAADWVQRAS